MTALPQGVLGGCSRNPQPLDAAELEALKQANKVLDDLLAQHKVTADDIVADYKKARRKGLR